MKCDKGKMLLYGSFKARWRIWSPNANRLIGIFSLVFDY
jgi:hypothetical protein